MMRFSFKPVGPTTIRYNPAIKKKTFAQSFRHTYRVPQLVECTSLLIHLLLVSFPLLNYLFSV